MKINLFNYTITIKKKKIKKVRKTYGKFGIDAPVAPPGYMHRWIRQEVVEIRNSKKIGFTFVKASDHKESFAPTIDKGKFKGCIGSGGLVLARIPIDIFERRDYGEKSNNNK
tara:strand:+ start:530 stop:865 length:336 start_codon:yes stop_codon:yes gene_type:complete